MSSSQREPLTLLLPGGGPLGVAFQAGALMCLEDVFREGFREHVRSIIASSAGSVTGAFLSIGLTPQMLVKSMSGRFPEEIEYFDPSILLQFERDQVPNPFMALWRSIRFLTSELRRGGNPSLPLAARKRRYEAYLGRVDDVLNLVPPGWFSLAGLEAFLHRNLSDRRGRLFRFDHLPTNLFICATDLSQGRAVLFGKKRFADHVANTPFFSKHQYITDQTLAHAILCSSAIPFLFIPRRDGEVILADGDARNTAAVGVAKSLVQARFMLAINPLVPLPDVHRGSGSQMFLQTLLTSLEGNIVANLKMEFEEKYHREHHGEESFDIVYFRPSPEDMRSMTSDSFVNLFQYRAANVMVGYGAVLDSMRDHPEEAARILGRYGYTLDLTIAARRYALLQRRRDDPDALEDALLLPKDAVPDDAR